MPTEPQKTDKQIRDEIVSKAMAKIRDRKSPPPQKDLVVEARELAPYVQGVADSNGGGKLSRVPELLRQLSDEVERLREQWNTRFNTLCGNCGKRYLGPRDEHLHGFGKCGDKRA